MKKWIMVSSVATMGLFAISFLTWTISGAHHNGFPKGLAIAYAESSGDLSEVHLNKVITQKGIKTIDLRTTSADVSVIPSKDANITLHLDGRYPKAIQKHLLDARVNKETMTLVIPRERHPFFNFNGFSFNDSGNRRLTVSIPANVARVIVKTVSGDIKISKVALDKLKAKSVSGDIALHSANIKSISMNSTSGDLNSIGHVGELKAHSVSGDVNIQTTSANPQAKIGTTSGDIKFRISAAPDLKLMAQSISGDISIHTSVLREEVEKHVNVTLGSGHGAVEASSVSGDLSLKQIRTE